MDRHSDRLYRLAVTLVGNAADAEDVLQETLVGAYRGMGRFEGRSSVKTWLTKILWVQSAKMRRQKRRRSSESLVSAADLSVEGGERGVENQIDLAAALKQLSREHRDVLVLREYEQMSYEEIAAVLEVPRGTVESRLHRARGELRGILKSFLP